MLLLLIIILVLIWAAVIWSIYSSFMVFYSNFSESENYHKAYYTSISALERWELVVKQRAPWYVWNWWFILGNNKWSYSNWWSDKKMDNFSYLWNHPDISTIHRTINSRTSRIPSEWKWNIEAILSANDSKNYNMMDYDNAEIFLLYYDSSTWNPYTKTPAFSQDTPNKIEWEIRLPKKLKDSWFQDLNPNQALIWKSNELPKNDAIVDRQIRWSYSNSSFTIFSTQKTNGTTIEYDNDTVFREKDINKPLKFDFNVTNWNPLKQSDPSNHWRSSPKTIISPKESELTSNFTFKKIFANSAISKKQIRFSLLNLLKDSSDPAKIYPFLEYYITFCPSNPSGCVSDKYFTINGEWNYGDYQTNIIIQKPTVKETVLRNFTSIF